MSKKNSGDKLAIAAFVIAVWIFGGVLGILRVPPFAQIIQAATDFNDVVAGTNDRPKLLKPIVRPGTGLVASDLQRMQHGLTIIQGIMPGGNQVLVLDEGGNEVHRWTLDFFQVWPDADDIFPRARIPSSNLHFHAQGMQPEPDGSIVVNFSGLGVAKLDGCSAPVWRANNWMPHSITAAGDGRYWIPGHIPLSETPQEFLPLGFSADQLIEMRGDGYSGFNNSLVLVDSNGEVLRQLSILQTVFEAGLEHAIHASLQDDFIDPTHLNDIAVVSDTLAAKLDDVEAGDLLLSIRNMNMLAIVDEVSGELKWQRQGPWVRQHDVSITEDGKIELFNNRSPEISSLVDTSQILSFDPATNEIEVLFPVGEDDKFFTNIMGSHQRLENGNRLIVESTAGRVFEVSPQGEIVWDYRLPYDSETASLFAVAIRVPSNFFDQGALSCRSN